MKRLIANELINITADEVEKAIEYTQEYFKKHYDMFKYDIDNYFSELSAKDFEEKRYDFSYDTFVEEHCWDLCVETVQKCICESLGDKINDSVEMEELEKVIMKLTNKDFEDIASTALALIGSKIDNMASDIADKVAESIEDYEWQKRNMWNSKYF